jgi:site-specific DNA-methyltransferase (adenine-specific)
MERIEFDRITFWRGDNLELMKQTPDKLYDLAVVDPPYGIGVNSMNMGSRKTIRPDKREWDNDIPTDEYFNELFRISKYQIIWGGNYFPLPPSKSFIIWDKAESMYGRDFAECEFAWVTPDKPAKIYKKTPNQLDRIHPTQKPVKLLERIIEIFTDPGDVVIDPVAGSGSSLVAAENMGRKSFGFEIKLNFFKEATKWIESNQLIKKEIKEIGYAKTELSKTQNTLF